MTRLVVWTNNAVSGVETIADFEFQRRPARSAAVVNKILERVESIVDFPLAAPQHGAAADPGIRRLVFDNFVIIYRVPPADDAAIQVLSVRHQRQRPADIGELP